jgi:conjugative transfer region protein TrbK
MTVSAGGWVRIGAVAFIAFVVLVVALSQHAARPAPAAPSGGADPAGGAADPLGPELRRCQALGEAGASAPDCLRVWAESRRRFLSLGGSRP